MKKKKLSKYYIWKSICGDFQGGYIDAMEDVISMIDREGIDSIDKLKKEVQETRDKMWEMARKEIEEK